MRKLTDWLWLDVSSVVIGGETCGLPKGHSAVAVRVEHPHQLELTVESTLAIVLNERRGL